MPPKGTRERLDQDASDRSVTCHPLAAVVAVLHCTQLGSADLPAGIGWAATLCLLHISYDICSVCGGCSCLQSVKAVSWSAVAQALTTT